MALDDKDLFQGICTLMAGQPVEVIMAQYAKAKLMNAEIEKNMAGPIQAPIMTAQEECVTLIEDVPVQEAPAKPKFTKRSLKVKPRDSITDDAIFCCLCGEPFQSLTVKHLAKHGITVEDYKKLCGYAPNQALMSNNHLAKSKQVIAKAQQMRQSKKAASEG